MGQAAAVLPNPVQTPAGERLTSSPAMGSSSAQKANTDDLLSQLAGAEIDRLLADAERTDASTEPASDVDEAGALAAQIPDLSEDEHASAARTLLDPSTTDRELTERGVPATAGPSVNEKNLLPAAEDPEFLKDLDAASPFSSSVANVDRSTTSAHSSLDPKLGTLLAELNQPPPATADATNTGTRPVVADPQVDQLFQSLASKEVVEANPARAAPVPVPSVNAPSAKPPPATVPVPWATPPTALQTTAEPWVTATLPSSTAAAQSTIADLAAVLGPAASAAAASSQVQVKPKDTASTDLSLWLRPLEWLNRPFHNLSDDVRAFLGQAAIVTTLNAVAVILYVTLFRR